MILENVMQLKPSPAYRQDIDGLRAIAVLAVVFFHIGILPGGYLGVDVFFVISGFLITGIIYREVLAGKFSVTNFYLRRIRRIVPLVSFICVVALAIGMLTMLPDDLENLSQSIIATNFCSNNILQAITTKNYWDVVNEFKPLMHTWSLGIEEQYYLLYPLLFLPFRGKKAVWSVRILGVLAAASLLFFLSESVEYKRFYFLTYRFYELAIGGILATFLNGRQIKSSLGFIPVLLLLGLLTLPISGMPREANLILGVLAAGGVLANANSESQVGRWVLTNPFSVFLGKISFSLYMWHQVLLAFARYFIVQELNQVNVILILLLTLLLSVFTYYAIEAPFRDKKKIGTPALLLILGIVFLGTNIVSWYVYRSAGVIRDVPELDISRANSERNMHGIYNNHVREFNRQFSNPSKIRVLVLGDSFARDWANVLLESKDGPNIDLSYVEDIPNNPDFAERSKLANVIFISQARRDYVASLGIDSDRVWSIGTKNFGKNSGYFYNNRGAVYSSQRTKMVSGYYDLNRELKQEFPNRYIDVIGAMIDEDLEMPVFTPEGKFISQDCRHLTKAGAKYCAQLFNEYISKILAESSVSGAGARSSIGFEKLDRD